MPEPITQSAILALSASLPEEHPKPHQATTTPSSGPQMQSGSEADGPDRRQFLGLAAGVIALPAGAKIVGGENPLEVRYPAELRVSKSTPLALQDGDTVRAEIAQAASRISRGDRAHHPMHIVGAGPAGLAAGIYLRELGFPVTIYEAQGEVGGRVDTHQFPSGQYHDKGAMRIPLEGHRLTAWWLKEMGLEVRPFVSSHHTLLRHYVFGDEAVLMRDVRDTEEFQSLSPGDQQKINEVGGVAPALLGQVLAEAAATVKDREGDYAGLFSDGPPQGLAAKYDAMSLAQLLEEGGLSHDLVEFIGLTTGLKPLMHLHALCFVRDQVASGDLVEVVGGYQALPDAMAERFKALGGELKLNTPISAIHVNDDGTAQLTIGVEDPSVVTVANLLSTVPSAAVKAQELVTFESPDTPRNADFLLATSELNQVDSIKVLLHFDQRFWEDGVYGGAIQFSTDLGGDSEPETGAIYAPSDNAQNKYPEVSRGPGVMIVYVWGEDATTLGEMDEQERTEALLELLSRTSGKSMEELSRLLSDQHDVLWSREPTAGSAFAVPLPKQDELRAKSTGSDLHVTGCGNSGLPGWSQGAFSDSASAVLRILNSL